MLFGDFTTVLDKLEEGAVMHEAYEEDQGDFLSSLSPTVDPTKVMML